MSRFELFAVAVSPVAGAVFSVAHFQSNSSRPAIATIERAGTTCRPAGLRRPPFGFAPSTPSGIAPFGIAPFGLAPSGLAPSGLAPSGQFAPFVPCAVPQLALFAV